jgi:hypothetical protein
MRFTLTISNGYAGAGTAWHWTMVRTTATG